MLPEVGLAELLVVAVVALLVLKPEDVPQLMKKLGLWVAVARRNMQGLFGWKD